MLAVSTLVAVTAAIAGTQTRGMDTNQAVRVAASWTGVVTGLVGWGLLAGWWRYRLEQRAGKVLLQPRFALRHAPKIARAMQVPALVLLVAYTIAGIVNATSKISTESHATQFKSLAPYVAGGVLAMVLVCAILGSLWNWSVRICDRGVVHSDRFISWDRVIGFQWHPRHSDVLILKPRRGPRVAMIVTPEQRFGLEALLKEKLEKYGPLKQRGNDETVKDANRQ
jgi:hypothetical protein